MKSENGFQCGIMPTESISRSLQRGRRPHGISVEIAAVSQLIVWKR